MINQKLLSIILCGVLFFLVGCNDSTGNEGEELTEVTFAEPTNILSFAPLYVAIEEGFFEEQGIEPEVSSGGGGSQVIATLLSDQADFAINAPRAMFPPIEDGEDLVAIQSLNSALTFELAVSNEYMEENNITEDSSLEDRVSALNGATIGTNEVGDSGDVYMRYLMQLYGEDPSTLEMVNLQGNGPKIGGMQENTVDGGVASPPFYLLSQEEGTGDLLFQASEEPMYEDLVWEVVFGKRDFIEENPELATNVVLAIGQGIEFSRENPDEAAESIISYFDGIDVEILEEALVGMEETFQGYGEMSQDAWDNAQDPLLEFNELSGVNTEHDTEEGNLWTNEYIDNAFQQD
ncbi:ABC transporter substrate-binding protein [Salicibibacter cibi]|uniref:ABC transporter substrate-binding protein n=1 Tax=Salicibibacter cibi TaxID=2743001 RepID=A0A7T6ZCR8_9BACI|nr:ABC transporter substrate-binding protein [Salicibibacter cibi]QQK81120.1 ABC transporter substrate-binding protein [Salicibibacter cibi]